MAENTQDDTPTSLEAAGNEADEAKLQSADTKHGGGDGGASAPAPKDKEDEEDAALARMMAFQEEQQPGIENSTANAVSATADGLEGAPNLENNAGLDPNVAFLGPDDDENENENDRGAAIHPNHNNPAAVALRQRQALQNAARLDPDAALRNHPYLVRKLFILLRPSLRYTPLSLLAAGLLVHHTLRTRQQFFLALVYLQSSKLAYILLGNAIIAMAVSSFTLLTKLFLDGGLRPNERDSIGEHIRWDVTETCLALTIFRSELDVLTAIEFLGLVILKCLHWSVELRGNHLRMTEEVFVYPDEDEDGDIVENAESPPSRSTKKRWYQRMPRPRLTHFRYYSLVQILLLLDIFAVAHCALSVATHGPSVDILFGFECAILLVAGLSAMGSYHLHVVDGIMGVFHHLAEGEHHHVPVGGMAEAGANENEPGQNGGNDADAAAQEGGRNLAADVPPATRTNTFAKTLVARLANPWRDRRATLSFAIELQAQAAKFLFYLVFFAIVFTYYGMPINIFREVYVSFQNLRKRLIAFNTYRRLTHNMENRFESIKDEEELDRLGRTCIICREQMDLLGGCKKLPGCGHAFHTHCLREWLVQQQTCPTCRADIAANEARLKKQLERERATAAANAAAAEREAVGAAAGDTNNAAGSGVEATRANANESQAQSGEQARSERNAASGGTRPEQSTSSMSTQSDALPDGWTQHRDAQSGKAYYYNKDLGQSTWTKPVLMCPDEIQSMEQRNATSDFTASNGPGATDAASIPALPANTPESGLPQSGFPCLYQITAVAGAPVYSHNDPRRKVEGITAAAVPERVIPCAKLIVCTAMEYWPPPSQDPMLSMPDGFVRRKDVERFLMVGAGQG